MSSKAGGGKHFERWKAALISLFVFALYFVTRSASLDEWDSYQFAMGVLHFDLWKHHRIRPAIRFTFFLVGSAIAFSIGIRDSRCCS